MILLYVPVSYPRNLQCHIIKEIFFIIIRWHKKGSQNKNRPQKNREWRSYIAYAWILKFNKVENGKKRDRK